MPLLEKLVLVSRFDHLKSMVRLFLSSSLKSWTETIKTNLRRDILDYGRLANLTKQNTLAPVQL